MNININVEDFGMPLFGDLEQSSNMHVACLGLLAAAAAYVCLRHNMKCYFTLGTTIQIGML